MELTKKRELLSKSAYTVDDLRTIMCLLRSEGGCPWDREQTHKSIRNSFLEEAYEAVEGIDKGDDAILKEELGDVLLQVVFHARIAEEEGVFDLDDVADGICKKLILRHPHVFGDTVCENSDAVLQNWDEIKKVEKHQSSAADTLRGVSVALPSLVRAQKLQKKAAKVGFAFQTDDEALEKLREEFSELCAAHEKKDAENLAEEIGDLLFAAACFARMNGVDAEEALYRTNEKFLSRFARAEELLEKEKCAACERDVNKWLAAWKIAKKEPKNSAK